MKIRQFVWAVFVAWLLLCTTQAWANLVWRQPGPFPDGMDVWYGSVYNKTGVHDGKLQVGGWGDEYDTLARFNLSGLPQVADQAIVYLYAFPKGDASTPTPINWYLITSQWHSGAVGWDTRPASVLLGSTPASPTNGWYGVNITTYYNQWRSGNSSSLNYGLRLAPVYNNNRFDMFYSSSALAGGTRPLLYVYYTPRADDNILKLKWPLSVPRSSLTVSLGFGGQSPLKCSDGTNKEHNGVDYSAGQGTAVYAAEDGVVKESVYDSSGLWAYNIVLEHTSPTGGKYTTVYWHVNPVADVSASNPGGFVPKGMHIGTVANLGTRTHFHFGIRIGAYTPGVSGLGALPYATHPCNGYPVFPAGFINPEDHTIVIFQ